MDYFSFYFHEKERNKMKFLKQGNNLLSQLISILIIMIILATSL